MPEGNQLFAAFLAGESPIEVLADWLAERAVQRLGVLVAATVGAVQYRVWVRPDLWWPWWWVLEVSRGRNRKSLWLRQRARRLAVVLERELGS